MDTLEELKYYCEEAKPVGAMLLTGEWGCGKTYLIDHGLKETLKDKYIIIRISLFGIHSIDELKTETKKAWITAWATGNGVSEKNSKRLNTAGKVAKKIFSTVADCLPDRAKNIGNGVLSLDIADFIPISPTIEEKNVILVFDDLERASLPTNDLLGCINDYCENQSFHTIIVANEEKIPNRKSESEDIPYDEIKEKIIQRTVYHKPNYRKLVENIISDMLCRHEDYRTLLQSYIDEITTIFSGITVTGDSLDKMANAGQNRSKSREGRQEAEQKMTLLQKSRPHNIRSLKCALQDFERVYCELDGRKIENKEKWLFSYLAYVLAFRAGLIEESESYGTLFSDEKLPILYPGFYNNRYILKSVIKWIRIGEWDQEAVSTEFDYVLDRDKAQEPKDIVRTNRIIDIDENVIKQGFPEVLQMAYEGELSLNEYVNFITNSYFARTCNAPTTNIDWDRVRNGLNDMIRRMMEREEEISHTEYFISDQQQTCYTSEEWATYQIINQVRNNSKLMFNRNRMAYIRLMKENPEMAFIEANNKRFDSFDTDMANVTAEAFEKSDNRLKCQFSGYFEGLWGNYSSMSDVIVPKAVEGFQALKTRLQSIMKKYQQQELYIASKHTETFITVVDKLIEKGNTVPNNGLSV